MKVRTEQITLRFTPEEWALLEEYAQITSQPKAIASRDAVIESVTEWLRQRQENQQRVTFVRGDVRKLRQA